MVINEENRHRLYRHLEQILGPQEATTLMEHLPPVGWADVATRSDIEGLRAATKSDLESVRTSTESEFRSVRSDIEGLRISNESEFRSVRSDIEGLRVSTQSEFASMRAEMKADRHEILGRMERELRLQTWRYVTAAIALAGVVLASPHL